MIDINHKDIEESNAIEINGIEFVKVVRCKDCKHWVVDSIFKTGWCNNKRRVMETSNNWFCANGERRSE